MTESEFYARCKSLVGEDSDREWDSDAMAGFFQCFRDKRQPLESFLAGIPRGLEVFSRLEEVFDASSQPTQDGRTDLYCVVREPEDASSDAMLIEATTLIENYRGMAESIGERELVSELTPNPSIRLVRGAAPDPDPTNYDSLDVFINDVQCDWHASLSRHTAEATWMREAFYYLNCDYCLARYVNWPWYRDDSTLIDPFRPYYNLWRHGAVLRCESPDEVVLYLPSLLTSE